MARQALQDSGELSRVVDEARAMAAEAGQEVSSAHLVLALFLTPNSAELVLRAKAIDEDRLLSRARSIPKEGPRGFETLLERARETAEGTGATETRTLHLLLATARTKASAAHELLAGSGVAMPELAREVLSYVTGLIPRRFQLKTDEPPRPPPAAPEPEMAYATSPPPVARSGAQPARTKPPPSRGSVSVAPDPGRHSRIVALRRLADGLDAEVQANPYVLSTDEFPYLATLGRNLSELAAAGRIDPVIGREREVDEALDVLGKRRANNPVLVGVPGVGKTAVVEAVALRLVERFEAERAKEPSAKPRVIVELDVAGLLSGTSLRGALSEKLNALKEEMRRAAGRVVVFLDEIHTLVGAGQTGESAQDASNELKAALARGEFPCIGATTFTEFQRYFAQDPALERRFVAIRVDEPTVAATVEILRGVASRYATHHGVTYDEDAVEASASLSARHIRDRSLPDKAVAVLDHAGSRAKREGRTRVQRADVARTVARMARIPEERLLVTDAERLLTLETELSGRVIGHVEAVTRVATILRRNYAGFSAQRPLASFIFFGPTGVGKTELAKALAEVVFGGADALVRIDMSEFSEGHAVSKLVGAPPGYVGFGEGGQLTDAVRKRPACVVLLDEVEKAHRDTQQLLLQALDEGQITDGRGRRVDFTQSIIVMTSNLGAEAFAGGRDRTVGFGSRTADTDSVRNDKALGLAREGFPPELWNRIEERLVFSPLSRADLKRIAVLVAGGSSKRLEAEKRIRFEMEDSALDYLLDHGGFEPSLGARPIRQAFARLVEAPLAEKILRGDVNAGDRVRVLTRGGKLSFEPLTIIEPSLGFASQS